MKTRRVRFFRVIEFTFERTFEFLSKRNEVEAIFLAFALFPFDGSRERYFNGPRGSSYTIK